MNTAALSTTYIRAKAHKTAILRRYARSAPPTVAPGCPVRDCRAVLQAGEVCASGAGRAWLKHLAEIDPRHMSNALRLERGDLNKMITAFRAHYGQRLLVAEVVKATGSRSSAFIVVATAVDGGLGVERITFGKRGRDVLRFNARATVHAVSRCLQRTVGSTSIDAAIEPLVIALALAVNVPSERTHFSTGGGIFKTDEYGHRVMTTWLGDTQ